jgi:hypothetical protein
MSTASLILPPVAALSDAAARLIERAGTNASLIRAINKATWHLCHDLEILPITNGFLIPSGTRAGVVHRIDCLQRCSCESQGCCWHAQALEIVEEANIYRVTLQDRIASHRAALAKREIDADLKTRQQAAQDAMDALYS